MSAPSDTDAYSYAKFLVDIYPEDAIELLCKRGSCDVIESVRQQVDRNCIRLGAERGISKNKIKSMVLDSRWDDLKALRGSPTTSATTTLRHYRHLGKGHLHQVPRQVDHHRHNATRTTSGSLYMA